MPRIKIEDLPVMEELTTEEMTAIVGGGSYGGGATLGSTILGGEGPRGDDSGIEDGHG